MEHGRRGATRPTPGADAANGVSLGQMAALGCVVALLGALVGGILALEPMGPAPGAAQRIALGVPADTPLDVAPAAREMAPPADQIGQDEDALARLYEEPVESPVARGANARPTLTPRHETAVRAALRQQPPVPTPRRPAWQRYAVAAAPSGGLPMIAIVLDDLGLNRPAAWRSVELPGPLTLSLMTYAKGLDRLAAAARARGHELLLHVPMEPRDSAFDAGPNVLRTGQSAAELQRRLEWDLGRLQGFVGINNHMGSKFTASAAGVAPVMRELKARGLLFLDSLTSARSVGWLVADRAGVPYARRDVFLDHDWKNPDAIQRQLARLESIARRQGYAVGIGHPHSLTLDALARWLPEARRRGFVLVPISAIVRHRIEVARQAGHTAG
ncbi:MAG: divergent polysaccharide deacetylase family protein [Kiloniellaceae bacterium]